MISWSVPTRVDSHLQSRSRNGDGWNKAEGMVTGVGIDGREGSMGALDESAVDIVSDRGLDERRGKLCAV
jgi:hypothetical protein